MEERSFIKSECCKKRIIPQTLLITQKEVNTVINKETVLQRWSEYCENTLNCKTDHTVTVEKSGQCLYTLQNRLLNRQPDDADIEMAIKKLQNWKATVHDQIQARLIKEGGKSSRKSFIKSFQKCWRKRSYHMRGHMAKYVQFIKKMGHGDV